MAGGMIELGGPKVLPVYLSRPEGGGSHPGVILFHEAFGLNDHIKSVADRLAQEGYVVLAPDLYFQSPEHTAPYDQMEKAFALVATLSDEQMMSDTRRAIDYLKLQPFVRSDRIGAIGFCLGGRIAFLAAANFPDEIKATVPFYGGGLTGEVPFPNLNMNPFEQIGQIQHPMLLFFGAEDSHIPLDQVGQVERRLRELGKEAEVKVYEGAGHGFFCDERPSYHSEAAGDAWQRTVDFLSKNLN
jgi:carboxymethylenebutenolidase